MPYVNVPNDLSKIKTKIAFNLTKRQLICFGAGAVIGVPTYLLTRQAIGNTGALFAMLAIMLPAFLLAMYEKDGLPLKGDPQHHPGQVYPPRHPPVPNGKYLCPICAKGGDY